MTTLEIGGGELGGCEPGWERNLHHSQLNRPRDATKLESSLKHVEFSFRAKLRLTVFISGSNHP